MATGAVKTMRAARYYGKEDVRIETIPRPTLKPGYIRIAPAFVGICGTDLHEYVVGPNFCPPKRHPVTGEERPVGLGHEFSGVILEVGPDVPDAAARYPVGAKCAIQPTIYCGECGACRTGVENACPKGGFIGLSGGGGGMAEEVLVPASQVFPVSDKIPLDIAALVEPLSVAWHAVDASPIKSIPPEHATALVFGGGPIGLGVLQALRALGTKTIIISEVARQRQEFAREMGAHHILDPRHVDVVEKCIELSEGKGGVDVAFDCAGLEVTMKTGCHAIKSRGTFVNVAIWEGEISFNPNWLVYREGIYRAVIGYQGKDYRQVIEALEDGRIGARRMITSKIKIDDLVEEGIKKLVTEKDTQVKILVDLKASGLSKADNIVA